MKKLTITLASILVCISAYSQGTVTFANIGTGTAISNILTGAALPSGTTFRASLYWLPDSPSAPSAGEFDAAGPNAILLPDTTTFALAGQFNAGTRTAPVAGASTLWFQVRAWEVAFGTSYDAALRNTTQIGGRLALVGTSNPIRVKTGDPANNIPAGSLVNSGLKGFYVTPVPEPSVIGLGILGVGALLMLRRRK